MKKLLILAMPLLLVACAAMPMDCCKNMKEGEMCEMNGKPCEMKCCKEMHKSSDHAYH